MKGDFPDDKFSEADVLRCLDRAGLKYKVGQRYILTQCPMPEHEDKNPSVQIYKDDWFANCHATCGRFHITKAFPHLRGESVNPRQATHATHASAPKSGSSSMSRHEYRTYDLMEKWKKLPRIPRDHKFKNIPLQVLDDLGWRWTTGELGMGTGYFIPYFTRSKTSIPFGQVRHLSGERRFTFLKDGKPTCYGTWNLDPDEKLFLVEGPSDAAVLDACSIPWVAVPSSSSTELVKKLAVWCKENRVELVYAGDNDAAGDKLREALDEVTAYRVCQPPANHKDWGDFFVLEGAEAVWNYAAKEFGWIKTYELAPSDEFEPAGVERFGEPVDITDTQETFTLSNDPAYTIKNPPTREENLAAIKSVFGETTQELELT